MLVDKNNLSPALMGWYSLPVAETHAASKEAMKFDRSMPDSLCYQCR